MKLPFYCIALAGLSLAGCREELCYNHFGAADIDFKWSVSQDPSEPGSPTPSPSGVTVIVYDAMGQPNEMYVPPGGGSVNFGENGMQSPVNRMVRSRFMRHPPPVHVCRPKGCVSCILMRLC